MSGRHPATSHRGKCVAVARSVARQLSGREPGRRGEKILRRVYACGSDLVSRALSFETQAERLFDQISKTGIVAILVGKNGHFSSRSQLAISIASL